MGFRKTQEGDMGVLTIPQGTKMFRRKDRGKTFERARKEFDTLAMPSWAGTYREGQSAYSFKMRDEYWYVHKEDIPEG